MNRLLFCYSYIIDIAKKVVYGGNSFGVFRPDLTGLSARLTEK